MIYQDVVSCQNDTHSKMFKKAYFLALIVDLKLLNK